MPNDHTPRPAAQFHAWQNNSVAPVNGHLADSRLAAGATGAKIRVKVGEPQRGLPLPPTGPSELSFLSVDTRTPYVVDYPGEDP